MSDRFLEISERISSDAELRRALELEARELSAAASSSVLDGSELSPDEREIIRSMFGPGTVVSLEANILATEIARRRQDPPGSTVPDTTGGPPTGGGGGGCLATGTLVATPDGLKAIETLAEGSIVSTPSGDTQITKVRRYDRDGMVEIDLGTGDPVRCSANHPFLLADGTTVKAGELGSDPGHRILAGGELVWPTVTPLEHRSEVFELVLESNDSIYVGEGRTPSRPQKET